MGVLERRLKGYKGARVGVLDGCLRGASGWGGRVM